MTAKDMFEELGFKLGEINDDYIAYDYIGSREDCFVCFELKKKYFQCFYNSGRTAYSLPLEVDYKLYKAIGKQVEELGWE